QSRNFRDARHETTLAVQCVVVHDTGELKEDTYDWFAQDRQGTVWYFGEATKEFKPGGRVSTEGSCEAGVNGQPGIIMPANPRSGSRIVKSIPRGTPRTWGGAPRRMSRRLCPTRPSRGVSGPRSGPCSSPAPRRNGTAGAWVSSEPSRQRAKWPCWCP